MSGSAMSVKARAAAGVATIVMSLAGSAGPARAQATAAAPAGRPDAIVDLSTAGGVALVHGVWRHSEAHIVEVAHRAPGPDLKASGPPITTHDIVPQAGAADFDDSGWETIAPESLDARRSSGRLAFNWYRIAVTIPEAVGPFATRGSTAVFEIVLDDYAEVWVDGRLPQVPGQTGGSLVAGYNAPNRVVLTGDARPGQRFQIAVFGVNGPLSRPPGNFIWIRSATLDFHRAGAVGRITATDGVIDRHDPALDAIVPPGARIEKLADGFQFLEGPVWVRDGGYLLFSDPNDNAIYRYTRDGQVSVFRSKSGYAGADIGEYHQPGSNGLTLDREGRLTINEHGNRRVVRLETNGQITVLADRYQGKRLNSPNDLVYRSDGSLYFTDPPFGLPQVYEDPRKELPYSGIYSVAGGRVTLLDRSLKGPNGIAFSPDEAYLYVADWDLDHKVVTRFPVSPDGSLGRGEPFFDMTGAPGEEALDGLKVDTAGNLYVSGPGGVWIVSPEARHLGTIRAPELPANFAWGDDDGRTLYLAARAGLYRVRLTIPGVRP